MSLVEDQDSADQKSGPDKHLYVMLGIRTLDTCNYVSLP